MKQVLKFDQFKKLNEQEEAKVFEDKVLFDEVIQKLSNSNNGECNTVITVLSILSSEIKETLGEKRLEVLDSFYLSEILNKDGESIVEDEMSELQESGQAHNITKSRDIDINLYEGSHVEYAILDTGIMTYTFIEDISGFGTEGIIFIS